MINNYGSYMLSRKLYFNFNLEFYNSTRLSIFYSIIAMIVIMYLSICSVNAANVLMTMDRTPVNVSVKSWKELRDERIIKQDLDYSCGAASAATILSSFYGLNVTEKDLLDLMEEDGAASFQDLAEVVKKYEMEGLGLALGFEELKKLKVPAIAYMKYRDNDHFSVIRGISDNGTVLLGDPSWGNRKFTKHQFLSMWETRNDELLKGKILLILPGASDISTIKRDFFGLSEGPNLAIELLTTNRF